MPGAEWFPGATLNYAEHALGLPEDAAAVAVVAHSQTRDPVELTWGELRDQVARARAGLRRRGVGRGDRVVAYLPNIPETLVAFLATVSLGAVWASCAPEFGARSVVDRFGQIEPKVLLVVAGYGYGSKDIDRREQVAEIRAGLPTVETVVQVPYGRHTLPDALGWDELLAGPGDPGVEPVPFDHPLCVLFSSGTTGKPKAIVHSHGGILLEHLKNHALSWDLHAGDRILWFSTTAWMMWNALVSGLLVRASIVMIDGNPLHPDLRWQWRLAAQTGATLMGASPGFLMACRAEGVAPAAEFDLSRLRQIGAAGSPLPPEGYQWVHDQFGPDVLLNVGSGGTDVCSGIVQGSPLQPVWSGEISGPCLGVAAQAFDEAGNAVVDELGELVITAPMPSMPVGFWGDADGSRYRAAYFAEYPGIWRHGDWIRFSANGSCVIAGRSDATLNRGGVRLGTAEFYRVVEELPQVARQPGRAPRRPGGRQRGAAALRPAAAGHRAGRPAAPHDQHGLADGAVAAAHPRRDRRRAGGAAQPHRQEAGAAREADPARGPARRRGQPRRAGRPDLARRLRRAGPSQGSGMKVQRVAVVATGVIGASWAAQFLAKGLDVVATDPAPGAEERLRADVAAHWPILEQFAMAADASPDRLSFTADPAEAVADVDFVQENGPEREDVKHALFAVLDAAARPDVVLASSSSGLLPTVIARGCAHHPERVVIGHPFNPPHLIPLVEVVPGERTSDAAVQQAMEFYAAVGKKPIRLRRELPGHVANRLQAALWQEAYSLVERGVASVEDIDTAISHGPGLRWAVLGPFLNQHLSGGPGGIAHVLEHLGPPTEAWWRDLGQVTHTPELVAKIVAGVDDELAGTDTAELVGERDAVLKALLDAKSRTRLP